MVTDDAKASDRYARRASSVRTVSGGTGRHSAGIAGNHG